MTFAATTSRNPERMIAPDTCAYRANTGATINPGDLMKYVGTASFYATPMTVNTEGPSFCGVAISNIPISSSIDNASGLEKLITVRRRGVVSMKTETGSNYGHGDAVMAGTVDAQSVVPTGQNSDTYTIGYVWDPTGSAYTAGATGTTYVLVILRPNYTSAYV
jgi:hypothetical protein